VKPAPECGICIFHWVYERTAAYVGAERRADLAERVSRGVPREGAPGSNVGCLCNRALEATGKLMSEAQSYYEPFKERSNESALALLPRAKDFAAAGGTERERFERVCAVAAAANVAPLGAPSQVFSFPETVEILEGSRSAAFFGNPYEAVRGASRILYVADNAGELGFDSLVLGRLKDLGKHVTLVVKGEPLFEDARRSDAAFFALEGLVDGIVTSRGFLLRAEAEPPLAEAYDAADLLFCKGTGAFEALRGEDPRKTAVFLLKVKCKPIARETGVAEGQVAVLVEPSAA
jgi:damage-control phosphatase, subfamily I